VTKPERGAVWTGAHLMVNGCEPSIHRSLHAMRKSFETDGGVWIDATSESIKKMKILGSEMEFFLMKGIVR
jgi:hypothetical protein